FFFQAEDGIRDFHVTGVQTCALPIFKALGRKDVLAASGELDRLAASIARHAERSVILSDIDAGRIAARRIGGPLLFGRLWQRLEIGRASCRERAEGSGCQRSVQGLRT